MSPTLSARVRVLGSGKSNKNDPNDALSTAANLKPGGLSGRFKSAGAVLMLTWIEASDVIVGERKQQAQESLFDVERLDGQLLALKARIILDSDRRASWLGQHQKQLRPDRPHLRHPVLGSVKLVELTAEMVDQLLAAKAAAGLARIHVSRIRTILGDALKHAKRRGFVARNVAKRAVPPRTKAPVARRSFTPDEARALLLAARGERLESLVTVGLAAGLRPGELTGLLWSDLDLDGQPSTLTVSGAMKQSPDGRSPGEK